MSMKNLLFVFVALLSVSSAMAQLQLPQPSPAAVIKQTVGLTEIEIVYSSPAVNGRSIWGGLVPYGEMWRAGANSPTTISFSKDVEIDGKTVKAGKYALYITPNQGGAWTITLNSDPNAQPWSRKADNDVVSVKAKVNDVAHHERLAYSVNDFNDAKATVYMAWEKKQVGLNIGLSTMDQAKSAINRMSSNGWRDYFNSARYLLGAEQYDEALTQINTALMLNDSYWFNIWVKAQILNKKGMHEEAYMHAEKALAEGNKTPDSFWYKDDVEMALKSWKKK